MSMKMMHLFRPTMCVRSLSHMGRKSVTALPEDSKLDPDDLGFLSRKEITAHDIHERLHLICPNYDSHADWKQVALKYPSVFYRRTPVIRQILSLLTKDTFVSDRSVLLKNLWIFQFTPPSLNDKIITIKVMTGSEFSDSVKNDDQHLLPDHFKLCLTPFSERVIFWLMRMYKMNNTPRASELLEQLQSFNERVDFLADKLAVFPFDIVMSLDQHNMHRLILRPQQQIEELIQLYYGIGFQSIDLRKHLWLLTRTTAGLRPRIDMLKQHRIRIRPWMLSAPVNEVDRVRRDAIMANEFQSVSKILTNKLNIDSEAVKCMMDANPMLGNRKLHFRNVSEAIDYLMSEGFSSKEISNCPKALTMPISKLKTRVHELKSAGCTDFLSVIHENQQNFHRFIDQFASSNKYAKSVS